ncbi:MAG: hypothetical protein A2Y33_15030 [Spirochaetes bacterium GWF1_51_8]|nr:MAG: hypothetical protein A2Y33_15030 [Spirochaetes bacterium GWF1_51_8]
MRKYGFWVSLLFVFLTVSAVFAFDVKFDGEFRTRFYGFMNKDLDFTRNADFWSLDTRIRIGAEFEATSVFSLYYQLEVGNLPWGEAPLGGGQGADKWNLETKNMYLLYDDIFLKGKLGIIGFKTPLESEIDDDLMGLKLSFRQPLFDIDVLYSKLFNGTNESISNVNEDNDYFETESWNATHLYYVNGQLKLDFLDANVYFMRVVDDRFAYKYSLNWIGTYEQLNLDPLKVEAGFSFNFGNVSQNSTNIPLAAFHLYAKAEMKILPFLEIFGRFNMTTGNDTNTGNIEQFQVLNNNGNFRTDLGILFGGSPFNQQAYFNSKVVTADTRKNLTRGAVRFDDPGLMVIEVGAKLKFDEIGLETMLVGGFANTVVAVGTNNVNLLGIEFDLHNRLKLDKDVAFCLSMAVLLPGMALTPVYNMNHSTIILGSDIAFKIDGMIELKFK